MASRGAITHPPATLYVSSLFHVFTRHTHVCVYACVRYNVQVVYKIYENNELQPFLDAANAEKEAASSS